MILKSLLIWLAIIPLAILNGVFRDMILVRAVAPTVARLISGLMLSGLIFLLVFATVPWFGRGHKVDYLVLGAVWLGMTIAFEFGFGRYVARKPWPELFRAYTFHGGDLWPLVLLVVFLSPFLAAKWRGMF